MGFTKPSHGENREYFKPREHLDRLLAFTVRSAEENVVNNFGERGNVVYADVTVIDGPNAGTVFKNADVTAQVLFDQLSESVGRVVLGRMTRPGKAFILADASPADEALAESQFVFATTTKATTV